MLVFTVIQSSKAGWAAPVHFDNILHSPCWQYQQYHIQMACFLSCLSC